MEGHERLPHSLYGNRINTFRLAHIDTDTPIEWLFVDLHRRELRVFYLERHLLLAQAFIPLGGDPIVLVVARPDAREEAGIPAIDEIHAFVVPGNCAVQIHKGTWHEPPFPLVESALALLTSHHALTEGLGSELDKRREINRLDVEKRNVTERAGYILRFELP
jgi:ureidoglycolate lyase